MLVGRGMPEDAEILWVVSNGQVKLTFFKSEERANGIPRYVFIETPYLSLCADVYFSMRNWFNFEYPVKPHYFTTKDHDWIKERLMEIKLMYDPVNSLAKYERYNCPLAAGVKRIRI